MKKVLTASLLLVMLIAFSAVAKGEETKLPIVYENTNIGFSIELPASWEGLYTIEEFGFEYIDPRGIVDAYILHKPTSDDRWYLGVLGMFGRIEGTYTQERPPILSETCVVLANAGGYTFYFKTPNDPHITEYHKNQGNDTSAGYLELESQLSLLVDSFKVLEDALPPITGPDLSGELFVDEALGISFRFPVGLKDLYKTEVTLNPRDGMVGILSVYHKGTNDLMEYGGHLFWISKYAGEDEYDDDNPPIRAGGCWILDKKGGYTYAVSFPSDVQYDDSPDSVTRDEYKLLESNLNVIIRSFSVLDNVPKPDAVSPIYSVDTVFDEDGITADFMYIFPSGRVQASPSDTLLMANGEFIPQLVPIRDGHSLMPLRLVMEIFGASVDWDADTATATIELSGTTALIKIGEQFAEVRKNGSVEGYDLYTPAIIIDGSTFVPIRAVGEMFDKAVGYEEKGIAYHPVCWIDEKTQEWNPAIEVLQETFSNTLELMKTNSETIVHGHFADLDFDNDPAIIEIASKIDNMSLLRFIGRYALIDGPYTILASQDGTIYLHKTGFLMWSIHPADFTDPEFFIGGYFAG